MLKSTPEQIEYAKAYQKLHYQEHLLSMKRYYDTTVDKRRKLDKQNMRRSLIRELAINRAILRDLPVP